MFKITPIQDKAKQNELCHLFEIEFRPDAFAYIMFDIDTEALMGISQFEIGYVGYIYNIKEARDRDDFEAMFILGRATMNFIDLCGAHRAKAPHSAADVTLMLSLGFKESDGIYTVDMTDMFNGKCHDHK